MNIKKIVMGGLVTVASGAMALDYVEVTDVKARQRYPWNGLVDIDFELDSKATEPYQMQVTVVDNVGKTNLPVRTVYTEGISFKENPCMVHKDTSRILWDAAADLPDGFKCTNVLVTCQDTRTIATSNLYMIIDVSGGPSATKYPVTYTNCPPRGGWSDEYKTTRIVMRRVLAGSFMMGSPADEHSRWSNEDLHQVWITDPYYIGVYEVTESQWNCVTGTGVESKKPMLAKYSEIRGDGVNNKMYRWPDSDNVAQDSFVGKLRMKADVASIDLPLEAQWEYACRAGTSKAVNLGLDSSEFAACLAARCYENKNDGKGDTLLTSETYVGCYIPNSFGLYDMLGNAAEWCRDEYMANLGNGKAVDPVGLSGGVVSLCDGKHLGIYYVAKGGGKIRYVGNWGSTRCAGQFFPSWGGYYSYSSKTPENYAQDNLFFSYNACRSAARLCISDGVHAFATGFRLCCKTK